MNWGMREDVGECVGECVGGCFKVMVEEREGTTIGGSVQNTPHQLPGKHV